MWHVVCGMRQQPVYYSWISVPLNGLPWPEVRLADCLTVWLVYRLHHYPQHRHRHQHQHQHWLALSVAITTVRGISRCGSSMALISAAFNCHCILCSLLWSFSAFLFAFYVLFNIAPACLLYAFKFGVTLSVITYVRICVRQSVANTRIFLMHHLLHVFDALHQKF